MKLAKTIAKIMVALAAVAGAVYVIATYGDKIVAWAKKVLASIPCCGCCNGTCECNCEEAEATPVEEAAEEAPAEEVVEETAPAEDAEAVPAEEEAVADEADFDN